jgi:hypothetical protein
VTLPSLLLLLSIPFTRPFLFGERYAVVGAALALAAALAATVADGGRPRTMEPAARALLAWLALQWGWLLLLPVLHPTIQVGDTLRGLATVPAVVAASCIVLRDPARRHAIARTLVAVVVAACVSFAATALVWMARGVGSGQVGQIPASYRPLEGRGDTLTPMLFPFTTVASGAEYFGVFIPRFLGLGREPGVMACLIVWAVFMATRLGFRRRWVAVLILGLAGTQSSGGFGVLLLAWVLTVAFVIPQRHLGALAGMCRQFVGVGLLAVAAYLAVWAPAFGLEAKRDLNPASVQDRQNATMAGVHALTTAPTGLDPEDRPPTAGINVVAATSIIGGIGTGLTLMTLLRPWAVSCERRAAAGGVIAVVGTVLTAQPLLQSTGFYLLLAVAVSSLREGAVLGHYPAEGAAAVASPREPDYALVGGLRH